MTDEEIEKALYEADDIAISEDVDCCDVLDYINRLKFQCLMIDGQRRKSAQNHKIGVSKQRTHWKNKLDQARKETAKEIYDKFRGFLKEDEMSLLLWLQAIVKEYGVEVDE